MIDAHTFKVQDAIIYGVEKAVLLYNFEYWLAKNKANKKHIHDGYVWTYNTANALSELFPYMSSKKIARLTKELEDCGALISGNYNKASYDRTKWFTTPNYAISQIQEMEFPEMGNAIPNNEQPIPNNYQITTDIKEPFVSAKPKRSKFKYSDDDMKCAEWIRDRVIMVNPAAPKANIESWANTIRLINTMDGKTHREILEVFKWANTDSFWCQNIQSPDKLRKQFGNLKGRMINETSKPASTNANRKLSAAEENENRLRELYGNNRVERNEPTCSGVYSSSNAGHVQQPMETQQVTIELGTDDWGIVD